MHHPGYALRPSGPEKHGLQISSQVYRNNDDYGYHQTQLNHMQLQLDPDRLSINRESFSLEGLRPHFCDASPKPNTLRQVLRIRILVQGQARHKFEWLLLVCPSAS
jgi:hypothetical protein